MEIAMSGVSVSSRRYISVNPLWLKEACLKMTAEAPEAIKHNRKLTIQLTDDVVLFFDPANQPVMVGGAGTEALR